MHHRGFRRRARGMHGWGMHGFSGWGWPGRFFGPGEVRLALLSLLADGPEHGYQLMKKLEDRSAGMYRASAGTVYPTLQQLEDEGRVESEAANGKRVYRLTEDGRRELEAEAAAVRRIWRRAEELGDWGYAAVPEAWEVTRPAMHLVKAAFRAAARAPDPERIDRIRELLDDTAEQLDRLADDG